MNKVLIVGGTGYLGRHLTKAMETAGYDTYITGTKKQDGKNYYQIDFENAASFENLAGEKFDLVFVLASKLNSLGTTNLSHDDLRVNTTCYASFLEFLGRHAAVSKIIYISSMTVYGTENRVPVKEDGVTAPVNTYGLSKSIAEQITSFFCMHNNVNGVVLRLPGIYGGDRKSGFIYNVVSKCRKNEKLVLKSDGLIFWETININDLCSIIIRFIRSYSWKVKTEIFNIGYGQETDFYKTAGLIKQFAGSASEVEETYPKGYIPFYLSNEKIKTVISQQENFEQSLKEYVAAIE